MDMQDPENILVTVTSDLFPPAPTFLVNLVQPLADRLHLQTLPLHAHQVLLGYVFYQSLDTFVSPFISRRLFPKTYNSLSRNTRVNWDIHFVSFVQSIIMSALALYTVFNDEERQNMDCKGRIWGYTSLMGMCQGFALGYFLWDLKISVVNVNVLGLGSLLHAVASTLVSFIGFRPFLNYYGISFVLYELSTPMLNIHWFCDKLNLTGSKLQLYNGVLLLATFFGARVVWGNYASYYAYSDILKTLNYKHDFNYEAGMGEAIKTTVMEELSLGSMRFAGDWHVEKWLAYGYMAANTALSLLNIYWFGKMVDAIRRRFTPSGAKGGKRVEGGKVMRENGFGGYEPVEEVDNHGKKQARTEGKKKR